MMSRTGAILMLALALPAIPASAAENPLVRAYNQSGLELFRIFAETPGNVVFSPYSIGSAMAMTMSGGRGETQAEMHKALRHSLPANEIDPANARLLAALLAVGEAKAGEAKPDENKTGEAKPEEAKASPAKLRIANALMLVKEKANLAPAFEENARTNYKAEIFRGADLETVNRWVSDKTEGKIDKILERLDPLASHVLLNAIYFNAPWARAFDKGATRERAFNLTADQTADVPTMSQQGEFAIAKGDGYSAIRLPYQAEGLSMIVLLPDAVDGLGAVMASLDGGKADALIAELGKAPKKTVALSLPRFKTEFKAELIEPFKRLGMTKVFDPAQSDLSGLTGKPREEQPSSVDQIVHRAVIDVAEEGTEAAAATAVVVVTRTMRPDDVERFTIDRPFLFAIVDDKSGAILFAGRIADPRL